MTSSRRPCIPVNYYKTINCDIISVQHTEPISSIALSAYPVSKLTKFGLTIDVSEITLHEVLRLGARQAYQNAIAIR